jgi:competence protein ComEC
MLLFNPFLLKLDVGFQLSFLAMLGIIYLLPIFQRVLRNVPNVFQLREIISMTFSAQIFTLPILIFNFGYFSLVSPATNILTVPFSSAIMIFGFIFVFLGLIWQPLGWLLSFPSWLLLTYLTGLVDWFSDLYFSSVFLEMPAWFAVIFYLVVVSLVWRFRKRPELNFSGD